jgi:O-antigen/teichoic acid export membrane protein
MLRTNVVANYLGQGWAALMGIAFVPFYARHLGMAAYGLIGVFAVLQAAMNLLDLGITPTLNREMARSRAGAHSAGSIRDLLRTIEVLCAALTTLTIVLVWSSAGYLGGGWLRADDLPEIVVINSIKLMGLVLATRWLEQIYRGALQGLQDLVWLNAVQAVLATLRWGGAYLVLVYLSPTITAFFLWQGAVSLLTAATLVLRTYHVLPDHQGGGHFSLSALRPVSGFAAGMLLGALLTLLLTQADKLVISKLLPLKQLGYYTLASTVAGGLIQLMAPMNTAVYPKLTEQVTRRDHAGLARTYLAACEWMSIVLVPPALLLVFFPHPILLLWTGDQVLSTSVAALLALLASGTLCNGLVNLPYMLQLAHGWTSLSVRMNLVAVALMLPLTVWAVQRFGAVGAASVWLALNASYVLITAHIMHRILLPALKWRWYTVAVARPLATGSAAAAILLLVLPAASTRLAAGMVVLIATLAIWTSVTGSSALARHLIIRGMRRAARKSVHSNGSK